MLYIVPEYKFCKTISPFNQHQSIVIKERSNSSTGTLLIQATLENSIKCTPVLTCSLWRVGAHLSYQEPWRWKVLTSGHSNGSLKDQMLLLHLMHSFKASSDLLISAPSNLVCLSAELDTAPRSLPARSIRENFPEKTCYFFWQYSFMASLNTV